MAIPNILVLLALDLSNACLLPMVAGSCVSVWFFTLTYPPLCLRLNAARNRKIVRVQSPPLRHDLNQSINTVLISKLCECLQRMRYYVCVYLCSVRGASLTIENIKQHVFLIHSHSGSLRFVCRSLISFRFISYRRLIFKKKKTELYQSLQKVFIQKLHSTILFFLKHPNKMQQLKHHFSVEHDTNSTCEHTYGCSC